MEKSQATVQQCRLYSQNCFTAFILRHFPQQLLTGSTRKKDQKNPTPSGLGDTLVLFLSLHFLLLFVLDPPSGDPKFPYLLSLCPLQMSFTPPLAPPANTSPPAPLCRFLPQHSGPSPKHQPALLSQASALFHLLCLFYLRFSPLLGLVCLSL